MSISRHISDAFWLSDLEKPDLFDAWNLNLHKVVDFTEEMRAKETSDRQEKQGFKKRDFRRNTGSRDNSNITRWLTTTVV